MNADNGSWDGEWFAELAPEWAERVIRLEACGSTNDEARLLAEKGAESGTVVLAETQTAGRGRHGRSWFSSGAGGLAFTLVFRPDFEREAWPKIALATGLGLARALEGFGLAPKVKWPNDLVFEGKKVAGILVEAERDFVLIGVGLNVGTRSFPEELVESATSLFLESGRDLAREEVLSLVLPSILKEVARVGWEFAGILAALERRCALRGKGIGFESGGVRLKGKMVGFGAGGEMLVEVEGEVLAFLQADQVRVIR